MSETVSVVIAGTPTPVTIFPNTNIVQLTGNLVFSGGGGVDSVTLSASGGSALVGFQQLGTGAVARTGQAKMRDILHAVDFGVVADGTTDNAAALQTAINAATTQVKNLQLPPGQIRINSPLNCTDLFAGGLTIMGHGSGIFNTQRTTCILANTGGVAIDCTGSQYVGLRHLQIDSDAQPNPSTIGILLARSTTSLYAQFVQLEDVSVRMKTNMAANGGTGSYAILNIAAEIHNYHNMYLIADNPFAAIANKPAWLTSPFRTIDTVLVSMSVLSFSGFLSMEGLSATRPAFRATSLKCCHIQNVYGIGAGTALFDLENVQNFVCASGSAEGQSFVWAILRNGCIDIDLSIYSLGSPASPVVMPADFSVVTGLTLRGAYNTAWTRIINSGNVGSIVRGLNILGLAGNDGTVSVTNVANMVPALQYVFTGLTTGGLQNTDLLKARVLDYVSVTAISAASAAINTVFHDTSTGKLSWKDSGGTVRPLYLNQGVVVANGANAAAAPTQAEFNALVAQLNALLTTLRTTGRIAT